MKKNNETKKAVMTAKQFDKLVTEFIHPVAVWQSEKLAQRSAFLLFADKEVGEWDIRLIANPHARYHTAAALEGLGDAMIKSKELLGWIKANVRFAERELMRQATERSHGKD